VQNIIFILQEQTDYFTPESQENSGSILENPLPSQILQEFFRNNNEEMLPTLSDHDLEQFDLKYFDD